MYTTDRNERKLGTLLKKLGELIDKNLAIESDIQLLLSLITKSRYYLLMNEEHSKVVSNLKKKYCNDDSKL